MPGLNSAPRGRIRAADINIDGLPDLFLTLELQKKDGSTFPKSYVFLAEPCDESKCNQKAANHKAYGDEFPRTYFAKGASINGIDSAKITDKAGDKTTMMVPMDVDEDGRLDIVLQQCDSDNKKCGLSLLYNNEVFDSFFIKALMLAESSRDFDELDKHNFGSTIAGATFRYIVTDVKDKKYVRVAS